MGLLALSLCLVGCQPASLQSGKATAVSLESKLPADYRLSLGETWFARRAVSIPLQNYDEWRVFYENPFFSTQEFLLSGHKPSADSYVSAVRDWGMKVESATGVSEFENEDVSWEFQMGVLGLLGGSRILAAQNQSEEAIAMWSRAWDYSKRSMETGPGLQGLNQTVPILMSAQVGLELAETELKTGSSTIEQRLSELSLIKVAQQKVKEHLSEDVINRLVIFSGAEHPEVLASSILEPAGEFEVSDFLALEAYKSNNRKFDPEYALDISLRWTEDLVQALGEDWIAVDAALEKRKEEVNGAWGIDVIDFEPGKVSADFIPQGKYLLENLVAYDLCRAIVPMVESALVTQMSLDAARVSIAFGRAKQADVEIKDFSGLVKFDPAFASMVDPLTGKQYSIDFAKRVLRTQLKTVSKDRLLLSGVIELGVPF